MGRRTIAELEEELQRIEEDEKTSPHGVDVSGEGAVEEELVEAGSMTIPSKMKAWSYKEYGPKEVLSLGEATLPTAATGQVLVKVHAAALNPVDVMRRLGVFQKIGAADSKLPTVPGYDVAGVIVVVGTDVTKFKVGDRVYGDVSEAALAFPKQSGTLAQYVAVEEKLIAPIPARLSFAEAASLPLAIETAYQALGFGGLEAGGNVLILGGSGGVGSLAVQIAKYVYKAATVAATCSTPKVDFVKGLGADVVIDYKKEDLKDHPHKYDVVLDTVGKGETLIAVKESGRAIVLNGQGQPPILKFGLTSKGDDLEVLNSYLEDGTVKPIVDSKGPFKFSEVVDAYAYLESGRATGKVVISPVE